MERLITFASNNPYRTGLYISLFIGACLGGWIEYNNYVNTLKQLKEEDKLTVVNLEPSNNIIMAIMYTIFFGIIIWWIVSIGIYIVNRKPREPGPGLTKQAGVFENKNKYATADKRDELYWDAIDKRAAYLKPKTQVPEDVIFDGKKIYAPYLKPKPKLGKKALEKNAKSIEN